jgi:hypothetical protein
MEQDVHWTESRAIMVVSRALIRHCVEMYHEELGHPGGSSNQGYHSFGVLLARYMNPDIKACQFCQRRKKTDNRRADIPMR